MESKFDIHQQLPLSHSPKTFLLSPRDDMQHVKGIIRKNDINFPFILKPDIGLKSWGVEKIKDWNTLDLYLKKNKVNLLLQEFIDYPHEMGIYYIRYPNQTKGKIISMVLKKPVMIIGDGKNSIKKLLHKKIRFRMLKKAIIKKTLLDLNQVLKKGERKEVLPICSHSFGSQFYNCSQYISQDLQVKIDAISQNVKDFHIGRYDIKFSTLKDLQKGKNFSIIELNGVGGEPTHIYDSKNGIFFAWKEIIVHLSRIAKIARLNHKKGIPYLSFKQGIKLLSSYNKYKKKIKYFYLHGK